MIQQARQTRESGGNRAYRNLDEISVASIYRQIYSKGRSAGTFPEQRLVIKPKSSVALLVALSDRITSPLNIGEILVSSLYRQNYLAAEHRRDFGFFTIQTELPRR